MAGPCTDLTVVDFSRGLPGAVATMVLSDFGAEVIKVEPPGGDPFRKHPSWLAWNRGKKSIVLDLKTEEGRGQVLRLAEQADVVVESFRPGVTERLGMDYRTLSRGNPGLVYCSISGFGQQGRLRHLKGYEGIVTARTGRMLRFEGQTKRPGPVYVAVPTASWAASQAALQGILAALRIRHRNGRGQWVQTSLVQGTFPYDMQGLIMQQLSRKDPERFPPDLMAASRRVPTLQYIPVRTKDGHWIQMANLLERLFVAFIRAADLWDIYQDERFRDAPFLTPENRDILREIILERMQEKTRDEWMAIFIEDGDVAAEPFLPTTEGMKHEQFVYNRHVVEVDDPRVGPMKQLGLLVDLAETPGAIKGPAPDLGQHTDSVLVRLAQKSRQPTQVAGGGNGQWPHHPLEGVTILDFSTIIAGPYGASLMADLGARVIKVEPPEGDPIRSLGGNNLGIGAIKMTAGKESIEVDLKTEEGQEIVHKLIAKSDVILHNFRPGVPQRLGIDYERAKALNPNIIYVYIGGYGATGPHHRRPAAHPIPGALLGGALRQAGPAIPPPPGTPMTLEEVKEVSRWLFHANESNPDPNTSMAVASGILLALYARERTGQGQAVQVTMIAANAYANADEAFDYPGRPPHAVPDAECYGLHALYRLYPAREGWLFLACPFEEEWRAFCRTVQREELLDDPRFRTEGDRQAHDQDLIAELSQLFQTRTAVAWEEVLTAADVACVQADGVTIGAFFADEPHVQDNDFLAQAHHARFDDYVRHGGMVHFSEVTGRYGPGILGGEHTRSIMRELGYSDEQIDDLYAQGVINWEEINPLPSTVSPAP